MRIRATAVFLVLLGCSSSSSSDTSADSGGSADGAGPAEDGAAPGADGSTPADGAVSIDAGADTSSPSDAAGEAAGAFSLTSTALAEGAAFAAANTCDGANTSPPFAWSGAPGGTLSYALVLTDKTNGLVHWAIYDIPASFADAPAAIAQGYQPAAPAGAKQAKSIAGQPVYSGPCPPKGGGAHNYEFALYAMNVAALPGTTANTTKEQIVTLLGASVVGVAKRNGNYTR